MGWPRWLTCSERGRAATQGTEAVMAFSISPSKALLWGCRWCESPGMLWTTVLASWMCTFGVVLKLISWNRSTEGIIHPWLGT